MKRPACVLGFAFGFALGIGACTGSDPDPTLPSPDPAGNVVQRSGFEDLNCLGWTGNQATLTRDSLANTGSSSCRVCADHATSVWAVFQNPPSVKRGPYTVTASVHYAGGDAGSPQHVAIRVASLDASGNETSNSQERTLDISPSDSAWQKTTFDFAVQNDGESISVGAIVPDTLEGCFLLDDFTVAPKK